MGTGLQTILLVNNGLHIEIQIDREHPIGKQNPAGVKDVVLEAAVTTICDCEDSVTAVDGADKTLTFRNWLGLMQGNLEAEFIKAGKTVNRTLNPDREFTSVGGVSITLPGRRVMLIRNVGHLMTPNAVLLDGEEIPEGLLDTMITAYIALHQLHSVVKYAKSSTGSMYIVHELITVLSSRLPETSIPCFI
jgi:malate synthase